MIFELDQRFRIDTLLHHNHSKLYNANLEDAMKTAIQHKPSDKKIRKFFTPIEREWRCLDKSPLNEVKEDQNEQNVKFNNDSLSERLLSALQMPNLVVLSGSGTSLGKVGGPSMWNLWDYAVNKPDTGPRTQTDEAKAVIRKITVKDALYGRRAGAWPKQT